MKILVLTFFLLMSHSLIAEDKYDIAVLLGGGSTMLTGQLTKEDSTSIVSSDVLIKIPALEKFGFFAVEFDSFSVDNDGGYFDSSIDEGLEIFTTTIMPHTCFLPFWSLHTCLGAGLKLIEIRSDDGEFRQQLGDFSYSLRFGSFEKTGFNYGIKVSYTQTSYTLNDETQFFEIIPIAAQVGWGF